MAVKTSWSSGDVLTAADLTDTFAAKAAYVAWSAYTPTIGGTGWDLGDGQILGGRYAKVGKIVVARSMIKWGSTSTYGGGQLTISLPVAAKVVSGTYIGTTYLEFRDVSTNERFLGMARITGATTLSCHYIASATGLTGALINTSPFTWATSDEVEFSVVYEEA